MIKSINFLLSDTRPTYINPFFVFALAVLLGGILYSLKLSRLYGQYNHTLFWLMMALAGSSLLIGFLFSRIMKSRVSQEIEISFVSSKNIYGICIFLWIIFILECAEFGGIPLVMSLSGKEYNYKEFGIQTLHVLFVAYSSIFAVLCFYRWTAGTDNKYYLAGVFSVLSCNLLMMGRGGFVIIFFSCLFVYLSKVKNLKSAMLLLPALALIMVLAFGYFGDKRMQSSGYQDTRAILDIGQAGEDFFTRVLPSGFFWGYLYASSPFANLLNQDDMGNHGRGNFIDFIKVGLIPDFISKHFSGQERFSLYQIAPELTVGTAFGKSFVVLGYSGVVALFVWYCIFCFFVFLAAKRSHVIPACGVLCSMSAFMLFDNMLIFSNYCLQLLFLVVLARFRISSIRLI